MRDLLKNSQNKRILDFQHLSSSDTKLLNEIAENLREQYTRFVDDCCKKYGDHPLFWATPFASRNIYNDGDTFLSLCRIFLAIEHLKKNDANEIITVFECERQIIKSMAKSDIQISTHEKRNLWHSLKRKLWNLFILACFCKQELTYMRQAGKNLFSLYTSHSIVITPCLSSSFNDYHYNDRYFNGITECKEIFFFPSLINNTGISSEKFIKLVRGCSNYKFLNVFAFLRIGDLPGILKYWKVVGKAKRGCFTLGGIDISPLIKRCLENGKSNTPAFKGILARQIIRRMSEQKLPVENFILWYEGRPSDVMVASAIREFFPNAGCVGFQGYPLNESDTAQSVSIFQYTSGHSPKKMAIPGKAYEPLSHRFCKDIPLLYIPILRNKYVLALRKDKSDAQNTILVVLSYLPDVCCDMLNSLNIFLRSSEKRYRILLKNHPVNQKYSIEDYGLEQFCSPVEFVSGTLSDCLREADLVITSTTTSALEILFADVPLVILYPCGKLGTTALPPKICDGLYRVAYEDELGEAIDYMMSKPLPDNSLLKDMLVEKSQETVGQMFC